MTTTEHHCIQTRDLDGSESPSAGCHVRKVLTTPDLSNTTIQVVELDAGAKIPQMHAEHGLELLVISGSLATQELELGLNGYALYPPGAAPPTETEQACTAFMRVGPSVGLHQPTLVCAFDSQPWLPGAGGLRVKPLSENTAFVHWPAGERFAPHRHFGGEEIYVISGQFEDEHGKYPAGTWLQSPHMSEHFPFVEQETLIFVKTGHLLPA